MVRVRVCELPAKQRDHSAEEHKASVARHIRTFHVRNALPSSLPASEHCVVSPSSEPLLVRSDQQLERVVAKLARPLLLTVTHRVEVGRGPPCARREQRESRVLYVVAQLSVTERSLVEDRLGELLREQGHSRFVLVVDMVPVICIAADLQRESCWELGVSSQRVSMQGGQIVITNDPSLLTHWPRPTGAHWAWCCPCAAAWMLGVLARPLCCGVTESRLMPLFDPTGGSTPFDWARPTEATTATAATAAAALPSSMLSGDAKRAPVGVAAAVAATASSSVPARAPPPPLPAVAAGTGVAGVAEEAEDAEYVAGLEPYHPAAESTPRPAAAAAAKT